jgi:hypothetical protein
LAVEESGELRLIVCDTWAASLAGDENNVQDTSEGLAALRDIAVPYHAALLIVHHVGVSDKNRARGSSSFYAALDMCFQVEQSNEGIIIVRNTKAKDIQAPEPLAFTLKRVPIGFYDEEGNEEVSAVLVPADCSAIKQKKERPIGQHQKASLECLSKLQEAYKTTLNNAGIPFPEVRILQSDWRQECEKVGVPKNRFYDARTSLLDGGFIQVDGYYVRLL